MENIQIFIYSTIQGITEFLPVSSSAHLYFIQNIYNWEDNALVLAIGAHLGTFLAVIVFNRKLFINFKKSHLLGLSLTASIPVILVGGLIGLLGFNSFNSNLYIIAFACIIGGILLELSDKKKKNKNEIVFKDSIVVGLFQILALIPGMSRSGTVITAMRFLGINRKLSVTFSLLTGVPVLFAACAFGIYNIVKLSNLNFIKLSSIITISFFSAIITIHFFYQWIEKFSFRIFSIYRVLLGSLILLYLI
ncbi:MAG: undecaprenyl-diphosphate phosphatase [Pseudomonadota bacterium]|nr:undecaprenyl-diphosphate phosphatase [Pseudomonadota bacterium]